MNDLTKEELQTIQELIAWGDDAYDPPSERIKLVQEKVQSMIDNYCDHESDGICYLSYPPQYRCNKCCKYYR